MPTTPLQSPGKMASDRHAAQRLRSESRPPTPIAAPPSPVLWRHCGNLRRPVQTCPALLPPLCCLLRVHSLLWNPGPACAQASNAARALTGTRPPPAGPSALCHATPGGRYPPQRPPRRPQEPSGRRRDLLKTKDVAQDNCHARRLTLQCTTVYFPQYKSIAHPQFGEKTTTLDLPVHVLCPFLCL